MRAIRSLFFFAANASAGLRPSLHQQLASRIRAIRPPLFFGHPVARPGCGLPRHPANGYTLSDELRDKIDERRLSGVARVPPQP
ncbi:MAG: hypothetical protein KDJ53_10155 [Rhodobiaceae bacterium]|nr:hypothetical protein [Rhodobiaceae bacterium]